VDLFRQHREILVKVKQQVVALRTAARLDQAAAVTDG
jgi:hypothetical protein